MNRIILLIIVCVLLCTASAFADDTAFGGEGASPMPIDTADVVFVDEKVVIRGKGIDDAKAESLWEVTCDFTFRNDSDQPVSLTMGFPFPAVQEDGAVALPKGVARKLGAPLVYDFSVTIDGKAVQAQKKKIAPNSSRELYYTDAYLWDVAFKPKETVRIHHRYTTGVTYDVMGYVWASYVLKTGGMWKGGTIGHARLEVIPGILAKPCTELGGDSVAYIKTTPKGMQKKGNGIGQMYIWDLKAFRPQKDLSLCLLPAKDYVRRQIVYRYSYELEAEKELQKKSPKELRLLRNTVFAQYGRRFKDSALQKYFDAQWWYVPNPHYNDTMLSTEDKELIALIARVEKKRR